MISLINLLTTYWLNDIYVHMWICYYFNINNTIGTYIIIFDIEDIISDNIKEIPKPLLAYCVWLFVGVILFFIVYSDDY